MEVAHQKLLGELPWVKKQSECENESPIHGEDEIANFPEAPSATEIGDT